MALEQRWPQQVIQHSDQGSQYTSIAFGERYKAMGVRPSMGSIGDAYDNAMSVTDATALIALMTRLPVCGGRVTR